MAWHASCSTDGSIYVQIICMKGSIFLASLLADHFQGWNLPSKLKFIFFHFYFLLFYCEIKRCQSAKFFCFCFFCSFLSSLLFTILCKVWKRLRRRRPTDWREAASVVKLVECSHDLSTVLWSIHWQGHLACYGRNYNNLSSFCSGLVVDLLWLTWKLCQK